MLQFQDFESSECETLTKDNQVLITIAKHEAENARLRLENTRLLETVADLESKMGEDDLAKQTASLRRQLHDGAGLVKEKDRVIEILKDELAAHQLELVQREEQLRKTLDELHVLEKDNKALVNRWMLQKEKDANKMNEAIESETSRLAKTSMSKVFSLFRSPSELSSTSEPSSPAPPTHVSLLPTKLIRQYKTPHDDDISCIAMNHDGTLLASGGNDKKLAIYSTATGQVKSLLHGSLKAITSICFNNLGDTVMASSNDNSIKLWDLESKRLKHTLTGHLQNVYAARFATSNCVISGSHDRTIKIWDLTKGYCIKNIFTLSSCNDVASLNADGSGVVGVCWSPAGGADVFSVADKEKSIIRWGRED
ncbi:hypothetical protein HDU91_002237 [Kappamyces sp. JEL0680]|nr:hypothetical protein HDU91_002237 [Kappamyces sp. JEL0680]